MFPHHLNKNIGLSAFSPPIYPWKILDTATHPHTNHSEMTYDKCWLFFAHQPNKSTVVGKLIVAPWPAFFEGIWIQHVQNDTTWYNHSSLAPSPPDNQRLNHLSFTPTFSWSTIKLQGRNPSQAPGAQPAGASLPDIRTQEATEDPKPTPSATASTKRCWHRKGEVIVFGGCLAFNNRVLEQPSKNGDHYSMG